MATNPVPAGRSPLVLFLSEDGGSSWQELLTLEEQGDACYTAMAELAHGRIHLVYSYSPIGGQSRDLKHLIIQLVDLADSPAAAPSF